MAEIPPNSDSRTSWRSKDFEPARHVAGLQIATLMKLAEASWRDFDQRRSYEWKANLALWSALGAIAGFAVKGDVQLSPVKLLIADACLGAVFWVYTMHWTPGLQRRNAEDQHASLHFWTLAEAYAHPSVEGPNEQRLKAKRTAELKKPRPTDLQGWHAKRESIRLIAASWSHGSQVAVTFLLTLLAVISLGQRPLAHRIWMIVTGRPDTLINSPRVGLDSALVLKNKIDCRDLAAKVEKEEFPDGRNAAKNLNQGVEYFESQFMYAERMNTCILLTGYKITDSAGQKVTTYQAAVKDLLTNKTLAFYGVRDGQLSRFSSKFPDFVDTVKDLVGEPLPTWIEDAPVR